MVICHDRHYPEGARAVALGGAEILLVPSATPDASNSVPVWEKELAAHAIFNEYFVGGLNLLGLSALHFGTSDHICSEQLFPTLGSPLRQLSL